VTNECAQSIGGVMLTGKNQRKIIKGQK